MGDWGENVCVCVCGGGGLIALCGDVTLEWGVSWQLWLSSVIILSKLVPINCLGQAIITV